MGRPRKIPLSLDPSRAVGYIRVSTEDQTLGPEAQRASIEAWAARNTVHLVSWHLDQGVSGAAPIEDRVGLLGALRDLKLHGAGLLVVAKLDRVARDVVIAAMVERLVERAGAKIASADGVGSGDGPEAALMRAMVGAFAAYERALIRARTSAALRALRAKGERAGEVPFGFRLAENKKTLLKEPQEQAAMVLAKGLRVSGWTLQQIADELTNQGYRPRGARWHPTTVGRMVRGG